MGIVERVKSLFQKPTIGSYEGVKKSIVSGGGVPYPAVESKHWELDYTWGEAIQISDPTERYLKLGNLVSMKGISEGYEALNRDERVVYLVWMLESEVNNGGFDQFFFNSSGDCVVESLNTLREIGAVETANLLDKAVQIVFGEEQPNRDREGRWKRLERLTEEQQTMLNEIDDMFIKLKEPLFEMVVNHIG